MSWMNDNVAIFHLPKTGGTWGVPVLKDSLGGRWTHFAHKHSPMEDELGHLNGKKAVTFVRHPLGWYWSYWRFRKGWSEVACEWPHDKNGAERWMDKIDDAGEACRGSFDRFVNNCLDQGALLTDMYSHFLGITRRVDYVCRQENLTKDILLVAYLLGGRRPMIRQQRANVSAPVPDDYLWLNDETINRFVRTEGELAAILGYDCNIDGLIPERLM